MMVSSEKNIFHLGQKGALAAVELFSSALITVKQWAGTPESRRATASDKAVNSILNTFGPAYTVVVDGPAAPTSSPAAGAASTASSPPPRTQRRKHKTVRKIQTWYPAGGRPFALGSQEKQINLPTRMAKRKVSSLEAAVDATVLDAKAFRGAPRDCRVGEWGPWSECSKSCGIGEMQRRRAVVKHPRRGGRVCPPLLETKWCGSGSARDCAKSYFKCCCRRQLGHKVGSVAYYERY
ncbi:Thrombospondin type-1 domain-containing protein 7A [Frankliniella fusca]|uniref:Thrombospondin type-1 domain-containing protein 7A n=1 Tax=Frankliniella fusca TaxID=407009 RepID=A0AAE1H7Z9_9NEOP|nr:Thrombospondin type-1 domain-containing protein 7A [Frankliniella fusca]